MLKFEKIYNYFNDYLQALKDELITDEVLKDTPIDVDSVIIRYNGGDIFDYYLSDRTFTIINPEIITADCVLFVNDIQLTADEYTISGNDITIAGGQPFNGI